MSDKPLWYSSFSTCILEVNCQHGNIDALISIFLDTVENERQVL
jgi:hypothetical protein